MQFVCVSSNELLNYVFEFCSGRGNFDFFGGYCVLLVEYGSRCFSIIRIHHEFSESDRHQFLSISQSRAMTEPVFRDGVVVFFEPPASQWLCFDTWSVIIHTFSCVEMDVFACMSLVINHWSVKHVIERNHWDRSRTRIRLLPVMPLCEYDLIDLKHCWYYTGNKSNRIVFNSSSHVLNNSNHFLHTFPRKKIHTPFTFVHTYF